MSRAMSKKNKKLTTYVSGIIDSIDAAILSRIVQEVPRNIELKIDNDANVTKVMTR